MELHEAFNMIERFIDSWNLFQEIYLLGWALSLFLPMLGILVLLRRQVFVVMAISNSAMLGIALSISMLSSSEHLSHDGGIDDDWWVTMLSALLASMLCFRQPQRKQRYRDTTAAVVFIMALTLTFLLLAHAPLGLAEIQQRLSSSLIGASMREFYITMVGVIFLGMIWWRFRRSLFLVCLDPWGAMAQGLPVRLWELAISTLLGLGLGWSIHLTGGLFVFGNLLLPVLSAKCFSRTMTEVIWVSPLIALFGNMLAFFLAYTWDYPLAQFSVGLQGCVYMACLGSSVLIKR